MDIDTAVKTYQCQGCVNGSHPFCYKKDTMGSGCSAHCPGTIMLGVGHLFLGMEKGFNRIGPIQDGQMHIQIFTDAKEKIVAPNQCSAFTSKGLYDNFNVPVWKYLDEHGNTLVRGLRPRLNVPFLHVFLWNALSEVHCLEVTRSMMDAMD